MKKKAFIRVVDVEMFRKSVVVMCGSTKELGKLVAHPKGHGFEADANVLRNTWPEVEDQILDDANNPDGRAVGLCIVSYGDIYIWLPEWDSAAFIHEAYHAVSALRRLVGLEDGETGAYLMEWLFKIFCWPEMRR